MSKTTLIASTLALATSAATNAQWQTTQPVSSYESAVMSTLDNAPWVELDNVAMAAVSASPSDAGLLLMMPSDSNPSLLLFMAPECDGEVPLIMGVGTILSSTPGDATPVLDEPVIFEIDGQDYDAVVSASYQNIIVDYISPIGGWTGILELTMVDYELTMSIPGEPDMTANFAMVAATGLFDASMLNGMRTLDEYLSLESDLVLPELPEADQRRMHKELMLCISNFDRCVDNARQDYRDDVKACGGFLRSVGRVVVGGATGCALGACYGSVVPGPGTAAGTIWGCAIGALGALTGGELLCIKEAKDDLRQKLRDCSTALDVCIDEYELRWF